MLKIIFPSLNTKGVVSVFNFFILQDVPRGIYRHGEGRPLNRLKGLNVQKKLDAIYRFNNLHLALDGATFG